MTYNSLIRMPTLNVIRTIITTHHLKIKFRTSTRVGKEKGSQAKTRDYYLASLKEMKAPK